jgi:hypothetical protein
MMMMKRSVLVDLAGLILVSALALVGCGDTGGGNDPVVASVTVTPGTATVVKGGTQQFSAAVAGTNDPAETVTWTLTGNGTGTTITDGGLLTVGSSETATSITVTATSTVDTSKKGTATVTVPAVGYTFNSLDANGSNLTGQGGDTAKITLKFNSAVTGLAASDITIEPAGALTKGTLTNPSTGTYELTVSGITSTQIITVAVAKDGVVFQPSSKKAVVYKEGSFGTLSPVLASLFLNGMLPGITFPTNLKAIQAAMNGGSVPQIWFTYNIFKSATPAPGAPGTTFTDGDGTNGAPDDSPDGVVETINTDTMLYISPYLKLQMDTALGN